MGKLGCPCGNSISDVMQPSTNNGWFLRDVDADAAKDWDYGNIIAAGFDVWECPSCGRIAIGNGIDNTVKWYYPEDGEPGDLCRSEEGE